MRRCVQCGSREFKKGAATLRADFPSTGTSAEVTVAVRQCAKCGETYTPGPVLREFELAVGRELADRGVHTGEAFRYVRKALGLRAADLARLLDVTPETISHWETGRDPVSRTAFVTLGSMVQDEIDGRAITRERLITIADARPRPSVLHPKLARVV